MRLNFKKIIFTLVAFFFLWLPLPITSLAADSTLSAQPNPQVVTCEDFSGLKAEVEKLRDENYSKLLRDANSAISRADAYSTNVTGIAGIFGVFIAVITIFFGLNFNSTRKEFAENLKEIKGYLSIAKQKAEYIGKLANKAEVQFQIIVTRINEFQKKEEELTQILLDAKKVPAKTKEEKLQTDEKIKNTLTEIKEEQSELKREIIQAKANIQTLKSLATLATESPSVSPSPSYSPSSPSYSPSPSPSPSPSSDIDSEQDSLLDDYGIPAINKKCSKCGKEMSELEAFLTKGKLCFSCLRKDGQKSSK